MTDQNGFFRFIWRVNALFLLIVLVLTALGLGKMVWSTAYPDRTASRNMAALIARLTPKPHYTLDPATVVGVFGDSDAERLYLLDEHRGFGVDAQKEVPVARNILAVDEKTGVSRWLFGAGSHAIVDQAPIYDYSPAKIQTSERSASSFLVGMAIVIAEADTNKDGNVDERDRQSLYVYRMDGKAPTKLLSAERIQLEPSNWQKPKLHVFTQDAGKSFALTYTLPDLSPVAKIGIPDLPNLAKATTSVRKVGFITEPRNVN